MNKQRKFEISDFTKSLVKVKSARSLDELIRKEFPSFNSSYNSSKGKGFVVNPENHMDCYFIEEVTE
jgi:hypothetical protein